MATGTNAIATREDCNSLKSGVFTTDLSKCPTLSEILDVGLGVLDENYASNQLIKFSDIGSNVVEVYWFSPSIYSNTTVPVGTWCCSKNGEMFLFCPFPSDGIRMFIDLDKYTLLGVVVAGMDPTYLITGSYGITVMNAGILIGTDGTETSSISAAGSRISSAFMSKLNTITSNSYKLKTNFTTFKNTNTLVSNFVGNNYHNSLTFTVAAGASVIPANDYRSYRSTNYGGTAITLDTWINLIGNSSTNMMLCMTNTSGSTVPGNNFITSQVGLPSLYKSDNTRWIFNPDINANAFSTQQITTCTNYFELTLEKWASNELSAWNPEWKKLQGYDVFMHLPSFAELQLLGERINTIRASLEIAGSGLFANTYSGAGAIISSTLSPADQKIGLQLVNFLGTSSASPIWTRFIGWNSLTSGCVPLCIPFATIRL